jgi:hypothetical protein
MSETQTVQTEQQGDKATLLEDQQSSPAVLADALMSLFAPVVHKIDGMRQDLFVSR